MTFSYTERPSENTRDEVRFLIQDTDKSTSLVHDEEISYALAKYSNNINAACALLCEVMATRHAKKQELSVSNYRQALDNVYKKLMDRAERFRRNAVTSDHFRAPAISATQKQLQEDNDDNLKPYFKSGLFDNPQAPQDPYDESTTLT